MEAGLVRKMEDLRATEPGRDKEDNTHEGASEEMSAFCDSVTGQVFSDLRVWRLLGRMLNFSDLKDCRRVCKTFNRMVLGETNFKSRALVNLTPATMKPEVFGTTEIRFKNFNLKLDPREPSKLGSSSSSEKQKTTEIKREEVNHSFGWFYPHLEEAEYLCLKLVIGEGIEEVWKKQPGRIFYAAKQFIVAAKKLKHLGIGLGFFFFAGDQKHEPLFTDQGSAVKPVLDCFEILGQAWAYEWFHYESITEWLHASSTSIIQDVLVSFQIRRFKLPELVPYGYYGIKPREEQMFLRIMLVTLAEKVKSENFSFLEHTSSHRSETTHLDVRKHQFRISTSPDVMQLCFSLKSIETRETSPTLRQLCSFFQWQPDLEEISINVEYGPLTPNLVETIGQRSSELRKLCLKASRFDSVLKKSSYWSFLKRTKLREFHLKIDEFPDPDMVIRHGGGMGFPRQALKSLPATVEKIVIRGNTDWTLDTKIGADDFAGICPKTLTELTLSSCGGCIDDGTVEYICKNFKLLQKLDLTGAINCTDHGFTGTSSVDATSPSNCLSDLKGLKKLILRGCTGITDATLNGIKFLELQHLDIVCCKVTPDAIQTLLNRNPSLETLVTRDATILGQKVELIAKHPRLKSIANY